MMGPSALCGASSSHMLEIVVILCRLQKGGGNMLVLRSKGSALSNHLAGFCKDPSMNLNIEAALLRAQQANRLQLEEG